MLVKSQNQLSGLGFDSRTVEMIRGEIDSLVAQRDELLDALRELYRAVQQCPQRPYIAPVENAHFKAYFAMDKAIDAINSGEELMALRYLLSEDEEY